MDPTGECAADDALQRLLVSLGASAEQAAAARATGTAGALALSLAVHGNAAPVTFEEARSAAGLSAEESERLWRALGFATASGPDLSVPADLSAAMTLLASTSREFLTPEASMALARVVGSAAGRLAEAIVDTFRMDFELPAQAAGTPYAEVVETYVGVARELLPPFLDAFGAILRQHLVVVAAGTWSPDADTLAPRRDLAVGFADLVGYTALARSLSSRRLTDLVRRFEDVVSDAVGSSGGRLVKLIGDGAMFVADRPATACTIALRITSQLAAETVVPPARAGVATGSVIGLSGDYFGDPVNLAARLVALALPSSVVVDAATAAATADEFDFERLPPTAVKGFHVPPDSYRLLPR